MKKCYTYDDVNIVPKYSEVEHRDKINIRTRFTKNIEIAFPIVSSPMDAYRCMMRSHIDAILVEGVIIKRNDQPIWKEEGDWRDDFELD